MRKVFKAVLFASAFLLTSAQASHSQSRDPAPTKADARDAASNNALRERWKAILNENTVTLISGSLNGGGPPMAYDIAAVLDSGHALRILPMVGKGAIQNMRDLMLLQSVDVALVDLVALDHFRRNTQLGEDFPSRLAYIAPLFHDELHLIARPGINSIRDLDGKRVNFSNEGDGGRISSRTIFQRLGVKVEGISVSQTEAIGMMKRGALDASLAAGPRPLASHRAIPEALGFKLIPIPYEDPLYGLYLPVRFSHDDYPNLIPKGKSVGSVAVQTLLAVQNWPPSHPRYKKLAKFTTAFFENFDKLVQPPYHPRWKTVNLAAQLPGWRRFPPAQQWLEKKHGFKAGFKPENERFRSVLDGFLTRYTDIDRIGGLSREDRNALYDSFARWLKTKPTTTSQ